MHIGLTGPIGSGKGVLAEYFKDQGFYSISLSQILREIARKEGVPEERTALQDLGNSMREKHGAGYLGAEAYKRILSKGVFYSAIDGIRNPGEIAELRDSLESFLLISIDAERKRRWPWIQKRNKSSDPKTWEEFLIVDERDLGHGEKETGQAVAKCMKMADYHFDNDGTERDLIAKIDKLYSSLTH